MQLVGLGCTAQVGKDTAAEYWEKRYPGRVKRVAFADKLKQVCMLLFGLSYEQCYGSKKIKETVDPRYGMSPREILQKVGEGMRKIYPNIWIDTVFNTVIPPLQEEGFDCFVISDVRYPNEGDRILSVGGTLVKVLREEGGVEVGANHSSETAMKDYKDFDFIIDNNGSFEEYYERLDKLMGEIGYGGEERRYQHRG